MTPLFLNGNASFWVENANKMSSDNFSNLVFRYTWKEKKGSWPFNIIILNVLYEIQKNSKMIDISERLNINLATLERIVGYLQKLGFVEFMEVEAGVISMEFFDFFCSEFVNLVGPVAKLIIEESIEDMGFEPQSFPKDMVPELAHKLTSDCQDGSEKEYFIKTVMQKVLKKEL